MISNERHIEWYTMWQYLEKNYIFLPASDDRIKTYTLFSLHFEAIVLLKVNKHTKSNLMIYNLSMLKKIISVAFYFIFTELSKIPQCFITELKKMSNISFLPDHHLSLKNNQQWQNFWMIYNMTVIRNKIFCLPASYDIIKFCIWRDNSFSLHLEATEKYLEKYIRTVSEIVSPTADFETIKNGISLVARLLR